jgi:ABC-type multidrug transport system permease subunit
LRTALALTISRMQLALRNRLFMFFSIIMPMVFLFLFLGIFARGSKDAMPAVFAQVIALTVMGNFWGLSVQLVMFREQGILRRFRLAPVGPGAMLISSVIANYILTLPTILVEFAFAVGMFHMRSFGNLWGVFIFTTLGVICFASLGLIIASVTNTMQETQVINQLIWFAFLFISGATVPLHLLPNFVQIAALFLPATYLVTGLQQAMQHSANPLGMLPEMLSLIGTTVIAFGLSVNLFRWDSSEKATRRAKLWATTAIVPFLLLGAWEWSNHKLQNYDRAVYERIDQPMTAPQENPH